MNDNLIWFNGEIIPKNQAKVSILSPTAQFGLNIFEGIRCYWNDDHGELYIFRLKDHLKRLYKSSRLIRLPMPYDLDHIEQYIKDIINASDFRTDIAVRVTIFCDGQGSWSSMGPTSMFIFPVVKPRTKLDDMSVFKACISSWQRINDNILPPRAKVGANYINGRYAHLQAIRDGYDAPIFLGSDGKVAEGAGACLFIVKDKQLITPLTTSSILESITRQTVIVLAKQMGIVVIERNIDRTECYLADEAFLCGTSAEIMSISSIDGYSLSNGKPGSISLALLAQYLELASGKNVNYPEWLTKVYNS